MTKALIFFDHDVTIRHFLKSKALQEIYNNYDVETIFYNSGNEKNKFILSKLNELKLDKYSEFYVSRERLGHWYHVFVPSVLNINRFKKNYKPVFEQMKTTHKPKVFWFYWLMSLPLIFSYYKRLLF